MLRGEVLGGEEVAGYLHAAGTRLGQGLTTSVGRLTLKLLTRVKADKLSGQVLQVRTGRLRRSINQRIDGAGTTHVSGTVGTNVSYARAHELGFKGTVPVRESLRTQVKAWGRDIEPIKVTVKAHSRKVNMPARSFLRSALQDMQPEIVRELGLAVDGAIKA